MEKIAVLMGGTSNEREISLLSGENIAKALAETGRYEVVSVKLTRDSLDEMPRDVDKVYIALHGGWGENGGVQAALDKLGIPYTGPGVAASQIAMDKIKTKMVLEINNIPTGAWTLASAGTEKCPLPFPAVVKPPADGSSVGISKVTRPEEWIPALDAALATMKGSGEVMVEEFLPGREMTVGIIAGEPLPVIEIVAKGGWYGYEEKYNSSETQYPFLEDAALTAKLQKIALDAWRATGCRGVARVDFRVSPLGRCNVLELNTSPGFTSHSLVPRAGMKSGLTFAGVCEKILGAASCN